LEKQGVYVTKFKRRFFQVSSSSVRYRDTEQNSQWQKEIPFARITSVKVAEGSSENKLRSFLVVTRTRTYVLRAESNVEVRRWIQAITLAKAAATSTSAQNDTADILAAVNGHPDLCLRRSRFERHSRSMSSFEMLGTTMFGSWSKSDDTQQRPSPLPLGGKHSPISQLLSATPMPDEKGWAQKSFENTIIQWTRQYFVDTYPIGVTTTGDHGLGPDAFCRFLSAVSPENILRDSDDRVVWIHENACHRKTADGGQSWLGVFNEIAPMAMHLSLHPISEAFRVAADYIQSHPLGSSRHTYLTVKNHTASKLGRQLTSIDKEAIREAMKTKHFLEKRGNKSVGDALLVTPTRSMSSSMSMRSTGLGRAINGSIEEYLGGEGDQVPQAIAATGTSDAQRSRSVSGLGLGAAINDGSIDFYLNRDDEQLATGNITNAEVPLVYRGGASLFVAATATGNGFAETGSGGASKGGASKGGASNGGASKGGASKGCGRPSQSVPESSSEYESESESEDEDEDEDELQPTKIRRSQSDAATSMSAQRKYERDNLIKAANTDSEARRQFRSL
jgi:hypothetical protein